MKIRVRSMVAFAVIIVTAGFVTSCQKEDSAQYAGILDVSSDGTSTVISQNMALVLTENSNVSTDELSSLLKMKEDEKLARDVYSVLYQKWGSSIFSRISNAENNHLNAIVDLLKYYGSADTLISEAGSFSNQDVQSLYESLIAQGAVSLQDAYTAGAMIEDLDIKDLHDEMQLVTDANIQMVYENLEKGSRNHLKAFSRQLTSVGVEYTPVYITSDEYNQIITSAMEKGKQYKMKGNGNGGQNCNGTGQMKRNGKR